MAPFIYTAKVQAARWVKERKEIEIAVMAVNYELVSVLLEDITQPKKQS